MIVGAERCVICGEIIPEGQQVCGNCMARCMVVQPQEAKETAEELRDIADVLSITANTDTNIKKSMEALLRIADRINGRNRSEDSRTGSAVSSESGAGAPAYGRKDGG